MAAVDSFDLLYHQVAKTCHSHLEFLAMVGALYTARKALCFLCESYNLIHLHVLPRLFSKTNTIKQYGEWAVVTGATDGIGKAYADELASQGMNIVLIAHNREELQGISEAIAGTYGVNTRFIEVDFSQGRRVYAPIKEALRHLDVGILVNCVGVYLEYPLRNTEDTEEKLWEIINVNVAAATMLVNIVLPGMAERKRGAIVNVSGRACCKPTPHMTMCSASKLYLDGFSQELKSELSPKGIFVQSLIPLCVGSKGPTSCRASHRFPLLVPTPEVYVRHAVQTLGVSTRTTGYWAHSMQLLAAQWFPRWMCRSVGTFLHPTKS
ncbi:inactive hydroxysteroid dehydrogenase-like protein 1 [Rhinophrynus dorsalis]